VHVRVIDRGLLGVLDRILRARGRGYGGQGQQQGQSQGVCSTVCLQASDSNLSLFETYPVL